MCMGEGTIKVIAAGPIACKTEGPTGWAGTLTPLGGRLPKNEEPSSNAPD
jgi:hypothetical protein